MVSPRFRFGEVANRRPLSMFTVYAERRKMSIKAAHRAAFYRITIDFFEHGAYN